MTLIDAGQIMQLATAIGPRWRVFVLTLGFAGLTICLAWMWSYIWRE